MPKLPLTGEFEKDYYTVTACMAFPKDEDLRERYAHCMYYLDLTNTLKKEEWNKAMVSFPAELLRDIISNPKDIIAMYGKAMRDLYKAHMIYFLLIRMYGAGIEEPSVNKAIFYLSEFKVNEDDTDGLFSESSLRKLWGKYKSVVHLYTPESPDDDFTFWLHPWGIKTVDENTFYRSINYSGRLYNLIASMPNRNGNGIYSGAEWIIPKKYVYGDQPDLKAFVREDKVFDAILENYAADRPY